MSLIMAKVNQMFLHLTDQKSDGNEWTVQLLRDQLHRYIIAGKMQIGKVLTKLITKARSETCGLHQRPPSLNLTLPPVNTHYCLKPNYRRISPEERK